MTQPSLFDADPPWLLCPRTRIERRFIAFLRANPGIVEQCESRVQALVDAGLSRVGIALVVESLRYDRLVRIRTRDFRIDNSFRSLLARLLIHRHPDWSRVIETRRRLERGAA